MIIKTTMTRIPTNINNEILTHLDVQKLSGFPVSRNALFADMWKIYKKSVCPECGEIIPVQKCQCKKTKF